MAIPLRMRNMGHDVLSRQKLMRTIWNSAVTQHASTRDLEIADMSTPEASQPLEEHSLENGEGEDSIQPQTDGKVSPEAPTNSSIVSASDIRGSVDDTAVGAPPEEEPSAENGSKNEDKAVEPTEEPASNGESANGSDDWQDVLGNGQLMKKVSMLVLI